MSPKRKSSHWAAGQNQLWLSFELRDRQENQNILVNNEAALQLKKKKKKKIHTTQPESVRGKRKINNKKKKQYLFSSTNTLFFTYYFISLPASCNLSKKTHFDSISDTYAQPPLAHTIRKKNAWQYQGRHLKDIERVKISKPPSHAIGFLTWMVMVKKKKSRLRGSTVTKNKGLTREEIDYDLQHAQIYSEKLNGPSKKTK